MINTHLNIKQNTDESLLNYKENLLLVLNQKLFNNLKITGYIYITYALIKRYLWNRGYFPYYFYYTRYMSTALAFISCKLIYYKYLLEVKIYDLQEVVEKTDILNYSFTKILA